MNKRIIAIIMLLLITVFLGFFRYSKQIQKPGLAADKIRIVASFYPLYFLSTQIAGDKAQVTNLMPAGAEPHDYEPTAQDMAKMERSRLIILNGGGLEAWSANVKKNIDVRKTIVVTAGEGLAAETAVEGGQKSLDPHIWLDPLLFEKMAERITESLGQADPANKDYYQANLSRLKGKLDALDGDYRQGLSRCAKRNIITAHAAFGYLAKAYGLTQVPITGLSPDAEPSAQQLADIVKFVRANNVKYIFFESLASPKLSQAIATEVGAQTLVLNPLEGLSGQELASGEDYLTVMQTNLKNLETALQCQK